VYGERKDATEIMYVWSSNHTVHTHTLQAHAYYVCDRATGIQWKSDDCM